MVAISLMIEGQDGLNWSRWQRLVAEAESLGFAGLFRSDHFTNANPPDKDSLEMIVSLTYLADHTQRIHFGPLVSPLTIRVPQMLARQAAALDDLSSGRMILGLGAGWQEREHRLFGYDLGTTATRMARLEEGLEVITRLLRSDTPVTFEGKYFQLRGATLLPRPQRPAGPRILVGGNGQKRTLPLVARYADVWNALYLTPQAFHERSAMLDDLLRQAGRHPGDVKRTMMLTLLFGRDKAALEQQLEPYRRRPELSGKSTEEIVRTLSLSGRCIIGTAEQAEQVIQQIKAYEMVGIEELMIQWFEMDDIDDLHAFASSVFPHIA